LLLYFGALFDRKNSNLIGLVILKQNNINQK
jgi:hypothetical protein